MPMAAEDKTFQAKVVVLGNTGVGKTSMVNRYIRGHFTGNTTATIGAAFTKKDLRVNGWNVVLQIWDTAGQERFRSMAPMYYRGAHAAILVFDATNPETLETVDGWVEELENHANAGLVMVIASNKSDMRDIDPTGCVPVSEAQAFSKEIGATLFQTSAKTGDGLEDMFMHVATTLLKKEEEAIKNGQARATSAAAGAVDFGAASAADTEKDSKCC